MRNRPKRSPTICSPFSRTMPASCGSSPARARSMLRPSVAWACASSSMGLRSAPAPEGDALERVFLELFVGPGLRADLAQKPQRRLARHLDEARRGRPQQHPLRLLRHQLREQAGLRRMEPAVEELEGLFRIERPESRAHRLGLALLKPDRLERGHQIADRVERLL